MSYIIYHISYIIYYILYIIYHILYSISIISIISWPFCRGTVLGQGQSIVTVVPMLRSCQSVGYIYVSETITQDGHNERWANAKRRAETAICQNSQDIKHNSSRVMMVQSQPISAQKLHPASSCPQMWDNEQTWPESDPKVLWLDRNP